MWSNTVAELFLTYLLYSRGFQPFFTKCTPSGPLLNKCPTGGWQAAGQQEGDRGWRAAAAQYLCNPQKGATALTLPWPCSCKAAMRRPCPPPRTPGTFPSTPRVTCTSGWQLLLYCVRTSCFPHVLLALPTLRNDLQSGMHSILGRYITFCAFSYRENAEEAKRQ